jgi:hypothetical protein
MEIVIVCLLKFVENLVTLEYNKFVKIVDDYDGKILFDMPKNQNIPENKYVEFDQFQIVFEHDKHEFYGDKKVVYDSQYHRH